MTFDILIDGEKAVSKFDAFLYLAVNNAGMLTFSLPPSNKLREAAQLFESIVTVEQDGVEIFFGRIIQYTDDKDANRSYICEGMLAMFGDFDAEGENLREIMANLQTESGRPWMTETNIDISADGTVKDTLVKFLRENGGYFTTHRIGTMWCLDYYENYAKESTQTISYGDNLVDINITVNSQFATNAEDAVTSIALKAIDKAYIASDELPLQLLDGVPCTSRPHGVNGIFLVTEMRLDLIEPSASEITLGKTIPSLSLMLAKSNAIDDDAMIMSLNEGETDEEFDLQSSATSEKD